VRGARTLVPARADNAQIATPRGEDDMATRREVQLRDGTIRYREEGSGQPLLFLHGIVVNGDIWRNVVPRLSKDFRCIVPDWPLGSHSVPMSPHADFSLPGLAELVLDFMDGLDLESATLVGVDSGGAIAQAVAAREPARVERLALVSCELYDRFLPPLFKPLEKAAAIPGSLWLVSQLLRPRLAQRLPFAYGYAIKSGLPDRATMESYLRPGRESAGVRRDLRKFLRAVDKRYTLEAAAKLRGFDKPVLLAWAADDKLFPLDYPRRFAAELPDARLEVIPDSYTFVPEDQPAALAKAIAAFVREPRGAAPAAA
jgi:pimeloyl-ACP methyl ester carboxylesterase